MFSEAIGELVTIEPEELMPVSSSRWWDAPPKIIGMILEVEDYAVAQVQREAKVHVITDVPGLASRICWIPVDHLHYLDPANA